MSIARKAALLILQRWVVWDLPHQHHAHSQVRIMEQVGGGELSSQASSLERRLTRDLGGEKEQASSRNSSSLMAGGQRPAGSGRGLDTMAAMTQAVTSLNMMTNRPGLTPATQPQQPLQFGSTSKQLFSRPGFNNTRFKHVRYKLPF